MEMNVSQVTSPSFELVARLFTYGPALPPLSYRGQSLKVMAKRKRERNSNT